jgi:hypothetical protein
MHWDFDGTFLGETASKANSRRIVKIGGTTRVIRSKKALSYAKSFVSQCPRLQPLLDDGGSRLLVVLDIWYASRRPDLDESLILDLMQDKIYKNDRSVRAKIVRWHLDKENPRSRIRILRLPADYGEPS